MRYGTKLFGLNVWLCAGSNLAFGCVVDEKLGDPPAEDGGGTTSDELPPGDTDAGQGTTAPQPAADEELCEAACLFFVFACGEEVAMDACVLDCLNGLAHFDGDPDCDEAQHTWVECVGQFESCGDLASPSGACAAAAEAQHTCTDKWSCDLAGGTNPDGPGCTIFERCDKTDPTFRDIACDDQTCTCKIDGEVVGQCPADGICENLVSIGPLAEICCGFEGYGEQPIPGEG